MSIKIEQKFKQNLDYLMKNKNGHLNVLRNNIQESRVREYESIGFINTGYLLNGTRTYSATPLAKKYYKDLFGTFAYLKLMAKKFLKR